MVVVETVWVVVVVAVFAAVVVLVEVVLSVVDVLSSKFNFEIPPGNVYLE
jgi:hypothetical protein